MNFPGTKMLSEAKIDQIRKIMKGILYKVNNAAPDKKDPPVASKVTNYFQKAVQQIKTQQNLSQQ